MVEAASGSGDPERRRRQARRSIEEEATTFEEAVAGDVMLSEGMLLFLVRTVHYGMSPSTGGSCHGRWPVMELWILMEEEPSEVQFF